MSDYLLYSGATVAQIQARVAQVAIITASGNWLNSFSGASGGSGVPSVNGISSAVTIAGAGTVSVSNSGGTVTVSGASAAGNALTSPNPTINTALVSFSGTTGAGLRTGLITTDGSNMVFPDGGNITLSGSTNKARIGDAAIQYDQIFAVNYGSTTSFTLSGANSNTVWSGKDLNLFCGQSQAGNHIKTSGSIQPITGGLDTIGTVALPYSGIVADSFYTATNTISGNYTATALDTTIFTAQTGAITIGIPKTAAGKKYNVISTVSSLTNTVTISGIGCSINNGATVSLGATNIGDSALLFSDGSGYWGPVGIL